MAKASVLGAGAWGTALAMLLSDNGHEVTLWSPFAEQTEELRRTRKSAALGEVELPGSLCFTSDLKEAAEGRELLVFATASVYTRGVAKEVKPFVKPGQLIVCVAKGIEDKSLLFQTDEVKQEIPDAVVTCLSGPSHAEEVARRLPTTCVAGAEDSEVAAKVQQLFMNRVFRVYTSTDVRGIELGGAVKNVIALAAGIADGLGYGDNTKAALITRGIAETARLGVKIGANWETFAGLTGIGDLIVTCASMHSRNRRAGILIGQGKSMEEAMREVGQVVEGVYSAKAALALAEREQVEMPIVEVVNRVLFSGLPAAEAVQMLMERDPVAEWNHLYGTANTKTAESLYFASRRLTSLDMLFIIFDISVWYVELGGSQYEKSVIGNFGCFYGSEPRGLRTAEEH